jgi:TfoX/Sxy family transcriptional regulator of competence genes
MEWQRASDELAELLYGVLPDAGAVKRRKMFGYPCAFVNGNMFAGVHGSQLFLRFPDPLYQQFVAETGAGPFEPMPGHAMKGYATLPPSLLADADALPRWVTRSFEAIAALPAKPPGARAKRTRS